MQGFLPHRRSHGLERDGEGMPADQCGRD